MFRVTSPVNQVKNDRVLQTNEVSQFSPKNKQAKQYKDGRAGQKCDRFYVDKPEIDLNINLMNLLILERSLEGSLL